MCDEVKPLRVIMLPLSAIDYQNTRHEKPLFELSREYKILPTTFHKTIYLIVIALSSFPDVEIKSLLLKTLYSLDAGLGGTNLELT